MRSATRAKRLSPLAARLSLAAAILCAGCGNYGNLTLDDAPFLNALPRASDLTYAVPQGNAQPLCLLGESSADQAGEVILPMLLRGVPDYGQDEMPAGGRDRIQCDHHRDGAAVLAPPGQPGPVGHRPGHRVEGVGGPVQAVRVLQGCWHQ